MLERALHDEAALRLQRLLDRAVRGLDVLALEVRHLVRKAADVVDGAGRELVGADDFVRDGDAVIVFTEGGRLVDDTGTVGVRDVLVNEDAESAVLILARCISKLAED